MGSGPMARKFDPRINEPRRCVTKRPGAGASCVHPCGDDHLLSHPARDIDGYRAASRWTAVREDVGIELDRGR